MSAPTYRAPTYEESAAMDLERDVEKGAYLSEGIKKEVVFETVQPVPEETVRNESDYARDPHKHTHLNWNPGFIKRFPWVGLGALCGVFACMGAAIAVLLLSDGKSQTSAYGNKWPKWISPSVILSGLSSTSSLCFSLAIANGVAIAWWRKTLKGATIHELHKSWSFATSIKEIALAGRKFNLIALAALTMKLTIIDGVLMQSATKTVVRNDPTRLNLTNGINVPLYQEFPVTGWVSPGNNGAGFMTEALKENLNLWETSLVRPAFVSAEGCLGICFANVTAIGFEFDCGSRTSMRYDFNLLVNESLAENATALKVFADALHYNDTLFKIAFAAEYSENSAIRMDLIWTQTNWYVEQEKMGIVYAPYSTDPQDPEVRAFNSCQGQRFMQTCTLRPALVEYPLMITNNSAQGRGSDDSDNPGPSDYKSQEVRVGAVEDWWMGPRLEPAYYPFDIDIRQQENFTIIERLPISEDHSALFPDSTERVNSKLAGIEVALNAVLGAGASLTKQQSGFIARQNGSAFSWSIATEPKWNSCNYNFMNPLKHDRDGSFNPSSIVGSINSMMLLLAASQYAELSDTLTPRDRGYPANVYAKSIHYQTNIYYMIGACLSTFLCVLCVLPVYWGYWQLGREVSLGPFEIAHAFQSPLTSEASQGSIRELMKEVGKREVKYGQYTTEDGRTVFVVADPDQLANLDRDTKAEFRAQMAHVMSRARSSRNNLPTLKTIGAKVEEKRDSA